MIIASKSLKLLSVVFVGIMVITLSAAGCTQKASDDPLDWENISQFKSSSVAGPDLIWVVTEHGELMRISNQGMVHKVATAEHVEVATFIDPMRGFTVDRKASVWTTADGGNTWQEVPDPQWETFEQPHQLVFSDALNGWLVGIFKVWRTTDGGKSWQLKFSRERGADPRIARLYHGAFLNADTAWVPSTERVMIHTNDGGLNWQTLTVMAPRMDLLDAFFINSQRGWIVAKPKGRIYVTSDAGKEWELQSSDEKRYLKSIQFVSESEGWAAGLRFPVDSASRVAVLLHTTDGGTNWSEVETGLKERFFERVLFYDQAHGWLVARDNIYATQDGGKTWRLVLSLPPIKPGSKDK
jgi:photosystem II stability/assembly factor-like uncharacterized protein